MHCNYMGYELKEKTKISEEVEKDKDEMEDCLGILFAVEKEDMKKEDLMEKALENIRDVAEQIKAENFVVFPFVHITSDPAPPDFAMKFGQQLTEKLKEKHKVMRIPFGWVKLWRVETKGHPLCVLSRRF
jgi:threonyl-tRNA synthetase